MNINPTKEIASQLGMLLIIMMLFMMIGQGLSYIILKLGGLSAGPELFAELTTSGKRQLTRIAMFLSHLTSFTIAGCFFLFIFHRIDFLQYIKATSPPRVILIVLSIFLVLFAYPIVGKLGELNMSMDLPEWMQSSTEMSEQILKGILKMEGTSELLLSLLLVGVGPAIGEELIYRGIVQNKLKQIISNPHIAITIAAMLFSLNHLQFERFLPFAFLGVILGYAYHYSNNIWVPIILHFLNNSVQVFVLYGMSDTISEMDMSQTPDIPYSVLYVSILASGGLLYLLKQYSERTDEQRITT